MIHNLRNLRINHSFWWFHHSWVVLTFSALSWKSGHVDDHNSSCWSFTNVNWIMGFVIGFRIWQMLTSTWFSTAQVPYKNVFINTNLRDSAPIQTTIIPISLFGLHLIIPQKILKRWNSGATPASWTGIRIDKPCPDLFHRIHELPPNPEVQDNIK